MSTIVGKRQWFNLPVADIVGRAKGDINYGRGRVEKGTKRYMKSWSEHAPTRSRATTSGFVTEDVSWGKFGETEPRPW